jgi:molybdopterin molybdotransferase
MKMTDKKSIVQIGEGIEKIFSSLKSVGTELITLEKGSGRILAKEFYAKHPLPNFDNSAMDGYGVSIIDVGKKVKVWKRVLAGDEVSDEVLPNGYCVKIMTGAKVPQGVNSIIPFEDVEESGDDWIQVPNSVKPNNHIRKKGEDIEVHETLLQKGKRLDSYSIGILASQGESHIEVFRKPKVVVFATGKELKMHFEEIQSHQIYNTNSPMIYERSKEWGAEISLLRISEDSKVAIKKAIKNSLSYDLIVTSGGVSVGEADFTLESFEEMGMKTIFQGVDIKPGKPTTFGKIGEVGVLNLPGNPSAGLINFEIFGRSAIHQLSGNSEKNLGIIECEILENLKVKSGKFTVVLGNFDGSVFSPLKKRSPGMVKPLHEANGFIILDKSVSELKSGSFVRFIPTKFSFQTQFQKDFITF